MPPKKVVSELPCGFCGDTLIRVGNRLLCNTCKESFVIPAAAPRDSLVKSNQDRHADDEI